MEPDLLDLNPRLFLLFCWTGMAVLLCAAVGNLISARSIWLLVFDELTLFVPVFYVLIAMARARVDVYPTYLLVCSAPRSERARFHSAGISHVEAGPFIGGVRPACRRGPVLW